MSYKDTCDMCEESLKKEEEHRKIIIELENERKQLLSTVSHLQTEVTRLNSKLDNLKDSINMVKEDEDSRVHYQFVNKLRRMSK